MPAGTQPLEILRLRGKGMPHLRGRGKGDACYRMVLEVPQKLNSKILLRQMADLRQEVIRQDRNVRFLQAGSREDVHNAIRNHGSRHDLSNCVVQVLPGPLLLRR